MRTHFSPFPFPLSFSASVYILSTAASSPEFSWKCSVFSTRILRLLNEVLRHKTLKAALAKKDGELTNRDTKPWRNEEERDGDRAGRESVYLSTADIFQRDDLEFLLRVISKFPRKCVSGFQRTYGVKCTCSAQLCSALTLMSYVSHA